MEDRGAPGRRLKGERCGAPAELIEANETKAPKATAKPIGTHSNKSGIIAVVIRACPVSFRGTPRFPNRVPTGHVAQCLGLSDIGLSLIAGLLRGQLHLPRGRGALARQCAKTIRARFVHHLAPLAVCKRPSTGSNIHPARWRCHVVESLMRVRRVSQLKSCGGDDFAPRLHG